VPGATCATSWLCLLGWLPFHSLGVAVALCGILSNGVAVDHEDGSSASSTSHQIVASAETPMCVDPGVWTLFNWIGHTATVGLVPLVWLIGDRAVRTNVVRICTPPCCISRSMADSSSAGGRSTASSTCATDLSSAGSRRRLDDGSTLWFRMTSWHGRKEPYQVASTNGENLTRGFLTCKPVYLMFFVSFEQLINEARVIIFVIILIIQCTVYMSEIKSENTYSQ